MQKAVMAYIQANIVTSRERERLRRLFDAMDIDFDGRLSLDEVQRGLIKLGLAKPEARQEAKKMFKIADIDQNRFLEFNEWCTAAMNKRRMLKRPHIQAAFQMLDKDKNGFISAKEVREILMNQFKDTAA